MGKAPVLIKINSNKDRFLLLQSFPVCRGIFPRHILKEAAESTHTFKAQNHRYLFDAVRGMHWKASWENDATKQHMPVPVFSP